MKIRLGKLYSSIPETLLFSVRLKILVTKNGYAIEEIANLSLAEPLLKKETNEEVETDEADELANKIEKKKTENQMADQAEAVAKASMLPKKR